VDHRRGNLGDPRRPDLAGQLHLLGLQTEDWVAVLVGCAASAVLALVVDQLLGLIETGVGQRARPVDRRRAGLAVGLARRWRRWPAAPEPRRPSYTIGAKNFSEQYVLAELMATRVEKGAEGRAQDQPRLGGRLPGARGRRDRRLCRLFRHPVGQCPEPHRTIPAARRC
jgi:hypothetical protein